MAPSEQTPATALLGVIHTLQTELQAQRDEVARARQEAAEDRAKAQRENARLVTMVEGLTKQLDLLLRDRDEERRAELAKLREEAKAAAKRAAGDTPGGGGSGPEPPPKPSRAERRRRSKHGRKPIPPKVPRGPPRAEARQVLSLRPRQAADAREDHQRGVGLRASPSPVPEDRAHGVSVREV